VVSTVGLTDHAIRRYLSLISSLVGSPHGVTASRAGSPHTIGRFSPRDNSRPVRDSAADFRGGRLTPRDNQHPSRSQFSRPQLEFGLNFHSQPLLACNHDKARRSCVRCPSAVPYLEAPCGIGALDMMISTAWRPRRASSARRLLRSLSCRLRHNRADHRLRHSGLPMHAGGRGLALATRASTAWIGCRAVRPARTAAGGVSGAPLSIRQVTCGAHVLTAASWDIISVQCVRPYHVFIKPSWP